MPWLATLDLRYTLDAQGRTISQEQHSGPMRVLQRLYPEGPALAQHVLLHPPGGLVAGDSLILSVHLAAQSQALITTPGAARFYRSEGEPALQTVHLHLAEGACLEWLPMETLAYPGCKGRNALTMHLAPGARLLGWDVLALGLPAAEQPFLHGEVHQHLHWPGVWLEHGEINAQDHALMHGPTGLAGHSTLGTLWLASGSPWTDAERETLLDAARGVLGQAPHDSLLCGATSPDPRLIVLRALAHQVEPLMNALRAVRLTWRTMALGRAAVEPRVWRM